MKNNALPIIAIPRFARSFHYIKISFPRYNPLRGLQLRKFPNNFVEEA